MNEQLKEHADELKQQKEAVVAQAQKIADLQAKLDDSEGECKRTSAALESQIGATTLKEQECEALRVDLRKEQDQVADKAARIKELEDQIASLRTKLTVDEKSHAQELQALQQEIGERGQLGDCKNRE